MSWQRTIPIAKVEDERRLVFGWLSVASKADGTPVVDLQGDVIAPAELEKAAYNFNLDSRRAGDMHERTQGIGRLVESCFFSPEKTKAMGLPDGVLPTGWWVGFRIDDDATWAKVKDGTYRAFSIGGKGTRVAE